MKKRFCLAISCVLVFALVFTGCKGKKTSENIAHNEKEFEINLENFISSLNDKVGGKEKLVVPKATMKQMATTNEKEFYQASLSPSSEIQIFIKSNTDSGNVFSYNIKADVSKDKTINQATVKKLNDFAIAGIYIFNDEQTAKDIIGKLDIEKKYISGDFEVSGNKKELKAEDLKEIDEGSEKSVEVNGIKYTYNYLPAQKTLVFEIKFI